MPSPRSRRQLRRMGIGARAASRSWGGLVDALVDGPGVGVDPRRSGAVVEHWSECRLASTIASCWPQVLVPVPHPEARVLASERPQAHPRSDGRSCRRRRCCASTRASRHRDRPRSSWRDRDRRYARGLAGVRIRSAQRYVVECMPLEQHESRADVDLLYHRINRRLAHPRKMAPARKRRCRRLPEGHQELVQAHVQPVARLDRGDLLVGAV